MVPHTRRRLLHVAVAGLGGLAGCNELLSGSADSSRSTAQNGGQGGDPADTVIDPPTVLLRADSEIPPIRPPGFERAQSDLREPERLSAGNEYAVIDSQSKADGLTTDDGETVSTFVAQTDFETETLFLQTRFVEACYRLRLCQVSWQPGEIATDYVRRLRPYDEPCASDNPVFESRLIRLPVALDADAITSFASSIGTGQCDSARATHARSGESDASTNATGPADGGEQ